MDGSGQTSREDPSAAVAAELTVSGAPEGRGERTENQRGNGGAVVFETSGAVFRGDETSTGEQAHACMQRYFSCCGKSLLTSVRSSCSICPDMMW